MSSFVGLAATPLLAVALVVILKVDRLLAVSGLLVGFGGSWLALLANQSASGGILENGAVWLGVGIVPLAIGLVALVATVAGEERSEHRDDDELAEPGCDRQTDE